MKAENGEDRLCGKGLRFEWRFVKFFAVHEKTPDCLCDRAQKIGLEKIWKKSEPLI